MFTHALGNVQTGDKADISLVAVMNLSREMFYD